MLRPCFEPTRAHKLFFNYRRHVCHTITLVSIIIIIINIIITNIKRVFIMINMIMVISILLQAYNPKDSPDGGLPIAARTRARSSAAQ